MITKAINSQLCKGFGIDKFHAEMKLDEGPSITRTETKYIKFLIWEWVTEEKKSFYRWTFSWTIGQLSWQVTLDPIVKKSKKGKNILYYLDEQEMRKIIRNLIEVKKGELNGLHTGDS